MPGQVQLCSGKSLKYFSLQLLEFGKLTFTYYREDSEQNDKNGHGFVLFIVNLNFEKLVKYLLLLLYILHIFENILEFIFYCNCQPWVCFNIFLFTQHTSTDRTEQRILASIVILFSVVKVRMAKLRPRKMIGKKAQVFRAWKGTREEMRGLRNPKFDIASDERCCVEKAKEKSWIS